MALQLPQNPRERISQLLPTVKCSSCNLPVALTDLGDHICPPPQPSTPRPSAILAKIRQASQSISIPGPLNTTNTNTNANANSNGSTERSTRSALGLSFRRSKTPQPAPSKPVVVPPPKSVTPGPGVFGRPRSSSMSRRPQVQVPPSDQMAPPLPTSHSAGPRLEAPSRVGTPQAQPSSQQTAPSVGRFDTLPRSFTPGAAADSRRPSISSVLDARMRAPSASEVNQFPNTALSGNPGTSRSAPGSMPPPSRPSIDAPPRMSMDRPGSTRPSLDSRPSHDIARVPSPLSPHSPASQRGPPGNGGGEVNMAGVGRRGFQAVAQAAMLAASMNRDQTPDRMRTPTVGMDGRRINAPRHLNINANVTHPSLSSLSPNTPLSSHSPHSPSPHSPNAFPQPGIASSRTPSPTSMPFAALLPSLSPKSPDTAPPGSTRSVSPASSRFSERFKNKELEIDTAKTLPQSAMPTSPSESDYSGTGLAYDQETESALSPTSPSTSLSTAKPDRVLFPSLDARSPQRSLAGLPARSASSSSAYSYASRSTAKSTGALELDRTLDTLFEEHAPLPSSGTLPLSPGAGTKSPKLPTRSRTTPAMGGSKEGKEVTAAKRRPRQCTRCNKSIDDGRWVRAEGAGVLCERCWKTMYLPKCRRCNRPIEKQAVSSADGQLKGKYHRECFNCHKCQQPFPDKEFYVFDGKPFCRYHYHEANDSLCADPACGQPIEGACAVAHTGERYHPEHLICEFRYSASVGSFGSLAGGGGKTRCTERLEEYWEVDGLMLCERHANMKMEMDIMAPDDDGADEYENSNEDGDGSGSGNGNDVLADLVSGLRSGSGILRMAQRDRDSDPDVRAHRRKTQFIDLR